MKTLKTVVVAASVLSTLFVLGACRRDVVHAPMKLGADVAPVVKTVR